MSVSPHQPTVPNNGRRSILKANRIVYSIVFIQSLAVIETVRYRGIVVHLQLKVVLLVAVRGFFYHIKVIDTKATSNYPMYTSLGWPTFLKYPSEPGALLICD